jgi:hypothetical protein
VTIDGAKSMAGSNSGVVTRIKTEMECSNFSPPMQLHCIIHQQALCSKVINLESVMDTVVSTVNFIRRSALNHRQFQQFLLEDEAEYGDVLYHTEIRWLGRGKLHKRFFELCQEIGIFLAEKQKFREELSDREWLWDLAFLADITHHVNYLQLKLKLFAKQLNEGNLYHFPCSGVFQRKEIAKFLVKDLVNG